MVEMVACRNGRGEEARAPLPSSLAVRDLCCMQTLRHLSVATLAIALAHLVFGGVVRITGSGMGCGDHWPKCHGLWFPPLNRSDLVIELAHRHLAVVLGLATAALCVAAWRCRAEPGVGGRGGVLRSAIAALVAVGVNGLFGALTVRYGNPWWATVPHWVLAMAAVAIIAATVVRTRATPPASSVEAGGAPASTRTRRAALVAALLAFGAVAMGGVTAKYPSAAVACPSFPLCGTNPDAVAGGAHIQLTHRVLGFLLFFHLIGAVVGAARRGERGPVQRAATIALVFTTSQIVVAGAMIGLGLPPLPRVLHQALGVAIWVSTFVLYYLTRRPPHPLPRAATPPALSTGVAARAT